MPTSDELIALAERVERAMGADRELDARISALARVGTDLHWAMTNYPAWISRANGMVELEKSGPSFSAPQFTASLDAAMTLVPEGYDWCMVSGPGFATSWCDASGDPSAHRPIDAATSALALTAACLRAKAKEITND